MNLGLTARIFAAVATGIFISVVILEEDAAVKAMVCKHINQFMSSTYNCSFNAQVKRISIFSAEVELSVVRVQSPDNKSWSWTADAMTVSCSWLKLITKGVFAIRYGLYGVHAQSISKGTECALIAHVHDLIYIPSTMPTEFVALAIHKGTLVVTDDVGIQRAVVPFDLDLLRVKNKPQLKIMTQINKGQLFLQHTPLVDQIQGEFAADIALDSGAVSDVVLTVHCAVPLLGQSARCHVQGTVKDKAWLFDYYSDDRAVHGTVRLDESIHLEGAIPVQSCVRAWGYKDHDIQGQLQFCVDLAQSGMQCAGEYTLDIRKGNFSETVRGVLTKEDADFVLTSTCREHCIRAVIDGFSYYPKALDYRVKNEQVVACKGMVDYSFMGNVQLEKVRLWLPAWATFQGTGDISFTGLFNTQELVITMMLDNGSLRIPLSYNLIKSARATCTFSFPQRRCIIQDAQLHFYKGSVSAQKIVVQGDQDGTAWVHAPVFLQHCFLSWQKDLFTRFSGSCLFEYVREKPIKITSYLVLERSHVRGNVLSSEFQKKLMSFSGHSALGLPAIDMQIKVQTYEPVHIKTPFLDAAAHVDLTLHGSLSDIDGFGEIRLERGTLKFPYKPLYMTAGRIYFLQGQLYDPHIELTAKNTVKKYTLGMSLRGTVREPIIQFESSPSLEEPQIITLLLGGSEDGSLYFAMPETLSKSLEKLVFGSAESSSTIKNYFRKWLRPLENIRIVPSFSDQTGRGGVRGSLAVEVNDRWRGFIEKNFNLSEDVKFGIEYDVSDDTSIRAVRDERGDIGGEIEMRWKL